MDKEYVAEIEQGLIYAISQEIMGCPVLHGSAVEVDGKAMIFLGWPGAGKSTLCTKLSTLGCVFLTDDNAAISKDDSSRYCIKAVGNHTRLCPDSIVQLMGHDKFPKIHASSTKKVVRIKSSSQIHNSLIGAIYILDRREHFESSASEVFKIVTVPPQRALIELITHSRLLTSLNVALGVHAQRIRTLAKLIESVPVRRLVYTSGYDELANLLDFLVTCNAKKTTSTR